jgi:transposase InsO family protein
LIRTSKFAFAELHDQATRRIAANFLRALIVAVPYKIHTVLTDNGTQFTDLSCFRKDAPREEAPQNPDGIYRVHAFDFACDQNHIEHRLTQPGHPWTNGQVESIEL